MDNNTKIWFDFLKNKKVSPALNKHPVLKFETGNDINAVNPNEESLIWFLRNPYVVVDIDDMKNALLLNKILKNNNYNYIAYLSKSKGAHFIFHSKQLLKSNSGKCWLDFPVEIKAWSPTKVRHVVIKDNFKFRTFINVTNTKLSEIPFWLLPHKKNKVFPSIKGAVEGDERNNSLFTLIRLCKNNKNCNTWEDLTEYINIINNYIFDQPIINKELEDTVLRQEIEKDFRIDKEEDVKSQYPFLIKNKINYEKFCNLILEKHVFNNWDNRLWVYDGEVFRNDFNDKMYFNQVLFDFYPEILDYQRKEVIVRLKTHPSISTNHPKPRHLVLKNGILNFQDPDNIKLLKFTSDIFCVKKINISWDESYISGRIKRSEVEKVLNLLANNDPEMVNFLLDIVANIFLYATSYNELCLIIAGSGGNGKSSFIEMIANLFGNENVSHLPIEDLEKDFHLAMIADSMVNLVTETSKDDWGKTSKFKSIISGDKLHFNKKHGEMWTGHCFCKMIVCANELNAPRDKSDALKRRIAIFPCESSILDDNVERDPRIREAIDKNEDGISETLFALAINRLKIILKNGKINIPRKIQIYTEKIFWSSDTVLSFLVPDLFEPNSTYDFGLLGEDISVLPNLNNVDIAMHYKDYKEYCMNELSTAHYLSKKNFKNHILKLYMGKLTIKTYDGKLEINGRSIKTKRQVWTWA